MMVIRWFFSRFSFVLKPLYRYYASRTRHVRFRGLKIDVDSGIFNPVLFYSTKDLIDYLESSSEQPKSLLELGCGSGMLSVYMARLGWDVTASDVNEKALKNTKKNADKNGIEVKIFHSDLFEKLNDRRFDVVAINPPYFQGKASNTDEMAWYCGDSFEYFSALFRALHERKSLKEQVIMVLSDKVDMKEISRIALEFEFKMDLKQSHNHTIETGFIFEVKPVLPLL